MWYATLQTAAGGVPIRDFRSYDPGRYLWTAGWASLLGSGIVGLRHANSVFQALGLFLALLSARRVLHSRWGLVLVGLVLNLWFFPSFKVYEHTVAVAAVFFALRLVERPTLGRHFACGVLAGLAGFLGRNLGIYCVLATLGLILFLYFKAKDDPGILARRLGAGLGGAAAGYAPMLLMLLLVPGFFSGFIQSILVLFGPGAPTLPKSVPWPWTFGYPLWSRYQGTPSILFQLSVYLLSGSLLDRGCGDAADPSGCPGQQISPYCSHYGRSAFPASCLRATRPGASGAGLPSFFARLAGPYPQGLDWGDQKRVFAALFAFLLAISVLVVPWQLYPTVARIGAAVSGGPVAEAIPGLS